MRLMCVSTVQNALPIAETWARWLIDGSWRTDGRALYDRLVVIDTGSVDGTSRVWDALRAEGLPIEVLPYAPHIIKPRNWEGHDHILKWGQAWALSGAAEQRADFVGYHDGDEWPLFDARADFEAALESAPADHAPSLTLANFIPTPAGQRRQTHPQDQVKGIAPTCRGDHWPHISAHRIRNASGSVLPYHRCGWYAHTTMLTPEQVVLRYAQQHGSYSGASIRAMHHEVSSDDMMRLALEYYGGTAEVDPNSRPPYELVPVRYPELARIDLPAALAAMARVPIEWAREKFGDDGLVHGLAELWYARYWKVREMMWSEKPAGGKP